MQVEQAHPTDLQVRTFGRRGVAVAVASQRRSSLADDLKLFAMTFVAGFLFVSLYLA